MFSHQEKWRARGQNRFCLEAGVGFGRWGREGEGGMGQKGEVTQTMYSHMNKCKNN
jgi:hypothetical protein